MQSVSQFPLFFTPAQTEVLTEWLSVCRWTWNEGLRLLMEYEASTVYSKQAGAFVPRSAFAVNGETTARPVPTAMFCNEIKTVIGEGEDAKVETEKVWAEHCWILSKGRKGGTVDGMTGESTHNVEPGLIRVGQCCPLPIPEWQVPRLSKSEEQVDGIPAIDPIKPYTLQYYFTHKNIKERYSEKWGERFEKVSAWFLRGVCKSLSTSWQQYKSGKRGCPRFKRLSDQTESLTHEDGKVFRVITRPPTPGERQLWRLPEKVLTATFIRIPKLGEVYSPELEKWGDRRIKVLRIVREPDKGWTLHLTGWEVQFGDNDSEEFEMVENAVTEHELYVIQDRVKYQEILYAYLEAVPWSQWNINAWFYWMLEFSLWSLKRRVHTTLQIVGDSYILAQDDKGRIYTALPMRKDGTADPHNLIASLEAEILKVQQQISWKVECHKSLDKAGKDKGEGKQLIKLYEKLAKLRRRQKRILENSRKKVAHFISERSAKVTIIEAPVKKQRKPKKKLKPGTFNPPEFESNRAEVVAENNKEVSQTAPGEFVALLKREAKERSQKVLMVKAPQEKKGGKKSKK